MSGSLKVLTSILLRLEELPPEELQLAARIACAALHDAGMDRCDDPAEFGYALGYELCAEAASTIALCWLSGTVLHYRWNPDPRQANLNVLHSVMSMRCKLVHADSYQMIVLSAADAIFPHKLDSATMDELAEMIPLPPWWIEARLCGLGPPDSGAVLVPFPPTGNVKKF